MKLRCKMQTKPGMYAQYDGYAMSIVIMMTIGMAFFMLPSGS